MKVFTTLFWGVIGITGFYGKAGTARAINGTGKGRAKYLAHGGSKPEVAAAVAEEFGVDEENLFGSTDAMLEHVNHMDGIAAVVPNDQHLIVAQKVTAAVGKDRPFMFLMEKPMARTLAETIEMAKLMLEYPNFVFALPHQYPLFACAWALVELVRSGIFGNLLYAKGRYNQGWLGDRIEADGQQQALWRTDPGKSGLGCGGDILSHIVEYLLKLFNDDPEKVLGFLRTLVPGRLNDDLAEVKLLFGNGKFADAAATQVQRGALNGIGLSAVLTGGTLEWSMENPEQLKVWDGKNMQIWRKGELTGCDEANTLWTFAPEHPEGQRDALGRGITGMHADYLTLVTGSRPKWAPANMPKLPGIREALRVATVLDCMERSNAQGNIPVPFELPSLQ